MKKKLIVLFISLAVAVISPMPSSYALNDQQQQKKLAVGSERFFEIGADLQKNDILTILKKLNAVSTEENKAKSDLEAFEKTSKKLDITSAHADAKSTAVIDDYLMRNTLQKQVNQVEIAIEELEKNQAQFSPDELIETKYQLSREYDRLEQSRLMFEYNIVKNKLDLKDTYRPLTELLDKQLKESQNIERNQRVTKIFNRNLKDFFDPKYKMKKSLKTTPDGEKLLSLYMEIENRNSELRNMKFKKVRLSDPTSIKIFENFTTKTKKLFDLEAQALLQEKKYTTPLQREAIAEYKEGLQSSIDDLHKIFDLQVRDMTLYYQSKKIEPSILEKAKAKITKWQMFLEGKGISRAKVDPQIKKNLHDFEKTQKDFEKIQNKLNKQVSSHHKSSIKAKKVEAKKITKASFK